MTGPYRLLQPGTPVATPAGPGTVAEVVRDFGHDVCDATWTQDVPGPPPRYLIRLDDGAEAVMFTRDVNARQGGACDP